MSAKCRVPTALRMRRLTAALAFALTGCAGPGYDATLSPEENQLRQSQARFTQAVGEGAAIGALAGAVAGALFGGHNRFASAAIGAGTGGALGAGAGYLVARNNASQFRSESDYRTAITEAEEQAADLRRSADAARLIADRAVRDIAALDVQYRSRQITGAQFRAQAERYDADNKLIQQQAEVAQTNASSLRSFAGTSGQYREQAMVSASDMEASRATLQRSAATLGRALATVPQGA